MWARRVSKYQVSRSLAVLVVLSATRSREALLDAIPLEPDRTWQKGTPRGRSAKALHRYSGLAFESRVAHEARPETHIDDLLARVETAQAAIRAFADDSRRADPDTVPVRFWIDVDTPRFELGIDVRADQLVAISGLGAALGVDVLVMPDEPEKRQGT